jgi:hypothetical protein
MHIRLAGTGHGFTTLGIKASSARRQECEEGRATTPAVDFRPSL